MALDKYFEQLDVEDFDTDGGVLSGIPVFAALYSSAEGGRTLPYIQHFETTQVDTTNSYNDYNAFTAPVSGLYYFETNLRYESFYGSLTEMEAQFVVNGTPQNDVSRQDVSGEYTIHHHSIISLSEGDDVQVQWDGDGSSGSLETDHGNFRGIMIA